MHVVFYINHNVRTYLTSHCSSDYVQSGGLHLENLLYIVYDRAESDTSDQYILYADTL